MDQQDTDIFTRLAGETGRIPWRELAPFFARGQLIAVTPELDLVAVATAFAEDDSAKVSEWMKQARVARVDDRQAAVWQELDQELWAVVVRPWILVQAVNGEAPEGA